MTKRTREPKLRSTDILQLSGLDVLKFAFNRKSFYRDYKLLHNTEKGKVEERLRVVTDHADLDALSNEIAICFRAALESTRPTYEFNRYLSDLVEVYYSDLSFSLKSVEIEESRDLVSYDSPAISYDWVLNSDMFTSYQRYLLFEYIVLGYTLKGLAERRYCTERTIIYHLNDIMNRLDELS